MTILRLPCIALALVLAGAAAAQERLAVVTTTTDLAGLVEAVGGEHVAVTSIAPPTMDAEDDQPKPRDAAFLKGARMVVRVGLDYDLWFDRLLAQAGVPEIRRGGPGYVDASFAIAVLEVKGAWSDPVTATLTATAIRTTGSIRKTQRSLPAPFSKHWRASIRGTRRPTRTIGDGFSCD